MPCSSCEKRRQMLAEAKKRDGLKGMIKELPAIVRDTVKNPPNIRKRKWVK
ncbi:hypothetical protein [Agrobacterium pusense]|uniref:hypothetical protein n=1 Tax=Agrobacterium pusense TaxID=648995 RepID=UPI002447AAC3|nr:hypothetical protein [Agrobacterium pusense]MDH0869745.1 hypothetical protein [Agrobacterium pusense]